MASFLLFLVIYIIRKRKIIFPYSRQNSICNTRLYSKETTKCNASVICRIMYPMYGFVDIYKRPRMCVLCLE